MLLLSQANPSFEQWLAFNFSPLMQGVVCILLPMLLACLGLFMTRRFIHQHFLRQHHDITGPFFNTMGAIYGVFLALIVSNTWHYYDQTGSNVVQEARFLGALYDNAGAFPDSFTNQIRPLLAEYRESVVNREWKSMRRGCSHPETTDLLKRISEAYAGHRVSGMAESSYFHESVRNLEAMKSLRASRIDDAGSGMIPFLWCILIAGAVATIGFSYLFGAQNFTTHAVMTTLLTGVICLTFYSIVTLDFPFTGLVEIGPDSFLQLDMR